MTQWYNTPQPNGQSGHWATQGDGSLIWVDGANGQSNYKGQGGATPAGTAGYWKPQGDGSSLIWVDNPSAQANPTGQGTPPVAGQNGHWYYNADGSIVWQDDTSQQGSYKGQGTGVAPPGHWQNQADGSLIYVYDNGMGGSGPGAPPPATGAPAPPPPVTYDPPAGGPTYTPGFVFGKGVIPGQGDNYQRQWFDVGPSGSTEALNNTYYNDPSNWGFAWDKVVNQFGGQVGNDFYKFLQGFSNIAKGDYQNSVPYDPNLNVASFLDQYAPQIKGVYDLLPSSQTHGGTGPLAGRSTY